MALAVKATRNAAALMAAGLAARIIALGATLVVVRNVSPTAYGEVLLAAIATQALTAFSTMGVGQYVIVKARGRPDLVYHVTIAQALLAVPALAALWLLQGPISAFTQAPGMYRFVLGMALAMVIDRIWFVPERVLLRDQRMVEVARARLGSELTYALVACVTALAGWGGMAVVAGNLARSTVRALLTAGCVAPKEWLARVPLRRAVILDVVKFGLPLTVGTIAGVATVKGDNLIVSALFGPAVMAAYNIAYNLSSSVAALVTDHMVDTVVPSFAAAEGERRRAGFLRAAALASLVATPLSAGLTAVAPTVVKLFLGPKYALVTPMLALISLAAVLGPMAALSLAYLQACARPRAVMTLQVFGAIAVLGGVAGLGQLGVVWASVGVVAGAALTIVFAAALLRWVDGIPMLRTLGTQVGALASIVPMFLAVGGVRWLLAQAGLGPGFLRLGAEIACGAVAYVGSAWYLAATARRDLIQLGQAAFLRRRAAPAAPVAVALEKRRAEG